MATPEEEVSQSPSPAGANVPGRPDLRLVDSGGAAPNEIAEPLLDPVEWTEAPADTTRREPGEVIDSLGETSISAADAASEAPTQVLPSPVAAQPLPGQNNPGVNQYQQPGRLARAISSGAAVAGGLADSAKEKISTSTARAEEGVKAALAKPSNERVEHVFSHPPGQVSDTKVYKIPVRFQEEQEPADSYPEVQPNVKGDTERFAAQAQMNAENGESSKQAGEGASAGQKSSEPSAGGNGGNGGGGEKPPGGGDDGGDGEKPRGGGDDDGSGENQPTSDKPEKKQDSFEEWRKKATAQHQYWTEMLKIAKSTGEIPPQANPDNLSEEEWRKQAGKEFKWWVDVLAAANATNDIPRQPGGEAITWPWDSNKDAPEEPPEEAPEEPPEEDEPPKEPTPEEKLQEAERNVGIIRDELVALTIKRRGRIFDRLLPGRKEVKKAYDEAMEKYRKNVSEYLAARGTILEKEGKEELEIAKQLMLERYKEMIVLKKREVSMNDELMKAAIERKGIRGKYSRLLNWWSEKSFVTKAIVGLGVGGVVFLASGPLGAGIAAVGIGSGIKFSLGVLNQSASARNRSKRSAEREIGKLEKERDKQVSKLKLKNGANGNGRAGFIERQTGEMEGALNKDVTKARVRNAIGKGMMLVGAGSAAYGLAQLLEHVPWPAWPWGGPPGPGVDMSNFHPNQFKGPNGNAAVWHAFDVIKRNHINVHGLNQDTVHAINADLASGHFHMAAGMEQSPAGGLRQHIVDWRSGYTPNYQASNELGFEKVNGSSVESWKRFMSIARQHGVTFSQEK